MVYSTLENYISKSKDIIESEYYKIIRKPGFTADFDPILIVIIHDFIMDQDRFSDLEVKLLAILVKLRKVRSQIYFKEFFIIMNEEIKHFSLQTREVDAGDIKSAFNHITNDIIDFGETINTTPYFKNESVCSYDSPTNDQRYSFSDDLPAIPFNFNSCSN